MIGLPFDLDSRVIARKWRRKLGGHPKAGEALVGFGIEDVGVNLAPLGVGIDVKILPLPFERFGDDGACFVSIEGDETIGAELGKTDGGAFVEQIWIDIEPE